MVGQIVLLLLNLFLIALVLAYFVMLRSSRRAPPFIPVPRAALSAIVEALRLTPRSVLYDLGSGDGRVLFAAAARHSHLRAVGVDHNHLVTWWARFKKRGVVTASKIDFMREDFFRLPLGKATHIFTYLYPAAMDALLPKLERELSPGARLVSADFRFGDREADTIICLPGRERELCSKLYVYVF